MGSGCGSVGRLVASDSRGPQFESSHLQNLYWIFTVTCIEKAKIKKKGVWNGSISKIEKICSTLSLSRQQYSTILISFDKKCPFMSHIKEQILAAKTQSLTETSLVWTHPPLGTYRQRAISIKTDRFDKSIESDFSLFAFVQLWLLRVPTTYLIRSTYWKS